jgi:hypothetical protein
MRVMIFDDSMLIGEASLNAFDPPMGVAMGPFDATSDYDAWRHANVVDGEFVAFRGAGLRVEAEDIGTIQSVGLSIEDWPSVGERVIHIIGISEPSFEVLFGEHPEVRAYWAGS